MTFSIITVACMKHSEYMSNIYRIENFQFIIQQKTTKVGTADNIMFQQRMGVLLHILFNMFNTFHLYNMLANHFYAFILHVRNCRVQDID